DVRVAVATGDEIGALSRSFRALLEWVRGTVGSLGGLVGELRGISGGLATTGQTVSECSLRIRTHVERSQQAVAALRSSLEGLEQNVELLESRATEGGAGAHSLAQTNAVVAQKVRAMADLGRVSAAALTQVAAGVERV